MPPSTTLTGADTFLVDKAADDIVRDENAGPGPVDPQTGQYPATSPIKVVEQKPISEIDDQTLIFADIGRRALDQVGRLLQRQAVRHPLHRP